EGEWTSSGVQTASARQVVGCQDRARSLKGLATRVQARIATRVFEARNQRRIDDADSVILREERLSVRDSHLYVVDPFHVRHVGPEPRIRELPILNDGFALKIRRKIVKRVSAGVIVVLIASYVAAQRKHRVRADHACPGRRKVKGFN